MRSLWPSSSGRRACEPSSIQPMLTAGGGQGLLTQTENVMHSSQAVRGLCLLSMSLAAGCLPLCPQTNCIPPPSLMVYVTDAATDAPLGDAVVLEISGPTRRILEGEEAFCPDVHCRSLRNIARARIQVSAEGYEPVELSVEIPSDGCGQISQMRVVGLQRLGSSQQAVVAEDSVEGC